MSRKLTCSLGLDQGIHCPFWPLKAFYSSVQTIVKDINTDKNLFNKKEKIGKKRSSFCEMQIDPINEWPWIEVLLCKKNTQGTIKYGRLSFSQLTGMCFHEYIVVFLKMKEAQPHFWGGVRATSFTHMCFFLSEKCFERLLWSWFVMLE